MVAAMDDAEKIAAAMPLCERCGEWPATDVDELCDFCGEQDALADERPRT
jgi:hypothetical protein